MKRQYAPSKVVPVRFHLDELAIVNKRRKRKKISIYIREKVLA